MQTLLPSPPLHTANGSLVTHSPPGLPHINIVGRQLVSVNEWMKGISDIFLRDEWTSEWNVGHFIRRSRDSETFLALAWQHWE